MSAQLLQVQKIVHYGRESLEAPQLVRTDALPGMLVGASTETAEHP